MIQPSTEPNSKIEVISVAHSSLSAMPKCFLSFVQKQNTIHETGSSINMSAGAVGLEMVLNSAGSVASIQCLQGRQFPMAIFMSIVPDADANTHINTDAGVIPRACADSPYCARAQPPIVIQVLGSRMKNLDDIKHFRNSEAQKTFLGIIV
uniref:Uncharacterized protein n=2 Tax=Physcomitrium patens TaxID=3218 RepID=A0A7I4AX59_PHYPA